MPGVRKRFEHKRGIRGKSIKPFGRSIAFARMPSRRRVHREMAAAVAGSSGFSMSQFSLSSMLNIPTSPIRFGGVGGASGVFIYPRVSMVLFDRSIIRSNWQKVVRSPLQRYANYIRILARRSIRRVGRFAPPSPPGTPPRSRWSGQTPPFKQIYNAPYGFRGMSQIVGMVGYNSQRMGELPVPGLHEHGGRASRFVKNRNRPPQPRGPKGQWLPNPAPAFIKRSVSYPQRQFMWPALLESREQFPAIWKHSISRG